HLALLPFLPQPPSRLLLHPSPPPPHPPSFPTRRSSDLHHPIGTAHLAGLRADPQPAGGTHQGQRGLRAGAADLQCRRTSRLGGRSEEHTSELQSLTNLVCRLLLEKKNDDAAVDTTPRHD